MEILTSIQISGLKIHFGTEFVEPSEFIVVEVGSESLDKLGSGSGGELLGFFLLDFFRRGVLPGFLGNRAILRQVPLFAAIEALPFPHELSPLVGLKSIGFDAFSSLKASSRSSR